MTRPLPTKPSTKPEAVVLREILAAIGALPGVLVMRNQVGAVERFDERTNSTRVERYGLGVGSADLVAILAPSGRWVCLEVKSATGRVEPEQAKWHERARSFGAFVAVVRSAEEACAAIERARRGEQS